jgi:hypothetical protein
MLDDKSSGSQEELRLKASFSRHVNKKKMNPNFKALLSYWLTFKFGFIFKL